MAQVFALNGTSLTYINKAAWTENATGEPLNGKTRRNRWRQHVWSGNVMTAAEFDFIYAQEGQRVYITTTDYEDPNGNYRTYYMVDLMTIAGEPDGPNYTNVQIEFLVRI